MIQQINIQAPINDTSYGIVSKNILQNLSCDYTLKPIGNISKDDFKMFRKNMINYLNTIDLNAPSLKIFHEHDLFDHIGKGPRIGFPIFEKNYFNPCETWNLEHLDMVLVASHWAKEVVESLLNIDCHVCPFGVSERFFVEQIPKNVEEKVIFYTLGKREKRKGHDYLHYVFNKAFQDNDDVELWMFTNNMFDSREEQRNFKLSYKKELGKKVKFFPRLSQKDMVSWINNTDCGVFLSRAEGFNLPLLESMAMGKDVIATYYSGHTEYLPIEYGINPKGFEEAHDNTWFNGGFTWVRIEKSEDEIVERLRSVYKLKKQSREANQKNINIAKQYTWKRTANEVLDGIQRV